MDCKAPLYARCGRHCVSDWSHSSKPWAMFCTGRLTFSFPGMSSFPLAAWCPSPRTLSLPWLTSLVTQRGFLQQRSNRLAPSLHLLIPNKVPGAPWQCCWLQAGAQWWQWWWHWEQAGGRQALGADPDTYNILLWKDQDLQGYSMGDWSLAGRKSHPFNPSPTLGCREK